MGAKLSDDLISDFKRHFGVLLVTRGKKHTFLGMNINITEEKKVEIEMKEQLLESIDSFGEEIGERVTTPASSHLFTVN